MERNFKNTILCLAIVVLIIITINSKGAQAKQEDINTIEINLGEEAKKAPILIHEEWHYSVDSFEVKIWYRFKNLSSGNAKNFTFTPQLLRQSIAKEIAIWDYEQYVNGNLTKKESFIECQIDRTKEQQVCTEPDITFPNNSYTEVQIHYKRSALLEGCAHKFFNVSEYRWFPFDCYQFNRSLGRMPWRSLFSLKLVLPRTLEPEYSKEAIRGSSIDGVIKYIELINKTNNEIIKIIPFKIAIFSPVIGKMYSYFEQDKKVVILPPTLQLSNEDPIIEKNKIAPEWLEVKIRIVRPMRERLLFISSVASMIFVVLYIFILKKNTFLESFWNSLKGIFAIWAFQEGIIELTPTMRPLQITLFDISFLVPLIIILIIGIVKEAHTYLEKRKGCYSYNYY